MFSNGDVRKDVPLAGPPSGSGAPSRSTIVLPRQKPLMKWRFITVVAFTVVSLGLFHVLYTHGEGSLNGLDFTTTQSSRIRELEEEVRKLSSRLDITAQSLPLFAKETQIGELEAVIRRLSSHLHSTAATAQSLMNSCSERQVRRMHLRLVKELAGAQDFALSTAGAKVISQLTTTRSQSPLSWLRSRSSQSLYPPDSVLGGSVRAGDCWDMLAPAGQLGISFSRPVNITHVTIDHIPQDLISDIERAPRHAVLWGVVDGKSNHKNIRVLMRVR